jgi:prolyl-tRNA synthetase
MMQDGKALQAGTSHYLGTTFAVAQNIRYQDKDGGQRHAHTTSWGVSTRLIGGVIMTHGDDDGLRLPPAIAPQQIIIVPMFRDDEGDAALLDYARAVAADLAAVHALGEPVRALVDTKPVKAATKRWAYVKKGAPLIVEIGGRDLAGGTVSVIRRDQLYTPEGKLASVVMSRADFASQAAALLEDIQAALFIEAKARMDANIARDVTDLAKHFKGNEDKVIGWVELQWARPTGAALAQVEAQLKALKLTIRNTPLSSAAADGPCFFTGAPAVERILVGRSY